MRVEGEFELLVIDLQKVCFVDVLEVFELVRVCDCDMIMSEKVILKVKLCA